MASGKPWTAPAANANGQVPAANILPLGAYATRGNGLVSGTAALNVAWSKTNQQQRDQLDTFIIAGIVLAATGNPGDTEILSSLPAGAASGMGADNDDGTVDAQFPSNFGRGWTPAIGVGGVRQGHFKPGDEDYITISVQCFNLATADAGASSVLIVNRAFVPGPAPDNFHGDVSIKIMNLGAAVDTARIVIRFLRDADR